jgi:hypothetical protein
MGLRIPNLVPRRRAHRVLAGALLLLVAAWFLVPQLFVPTIRSKLQGMIGGHMDARLQIGRLMYAPPFGVRARDVRLIGGGSAGSEYAGLELLKVARLDLKLARSPFHKGPLVIQNITVTNPEVHLVRTADGRLVGMHALVRHETPPDTTRSTTRPTTQTTGADIANRDEADPEAARAKVSDMFELRHFGIHGGRVVYEDRSRPGLPPVVWKDLNVGMETTPREKAVYGYTLDAEHGDLARLKSSGSFDLDRLLLDLGSLQVEARATYAQNESPLPAQVQQVLRDYRVEGRVALDADGHFDLNDRSASKFRAALDLKDASAYSPQWDASLDRLAVNLAAEGGGSGPVHIRVEQFDAASGDTSFTLAKARIAIDRDAGTWAVSDLSGRLDLGSETGALPRKSRPVLEGMNARGTVQFSVAAEGRLRPGEGQYALAPEDLEVLIYPRGVSLRPRKSPAPLTDIGGGGSIRKDRGTRVVVADNLGFTYGGDPALLASARLPLPPDLGDLRRQVRIEEISGTVDFRRPGPRYPGKFGRVVDSLRPVGPFVVGRDSWFAVSKVQADPRARTDLAAPPRTPPSRKSDWYFSVATDAGSFTLTKDRIPLTNMTGDATVSNMLIDVRRLEADVLGGRITGAVRVTPGSGMKYNGRAYLRGIHLDEISKVYIVPETERAKLSGVGNMNIEFAGERPRDGGSAMQALRAKGEFEVLRGHFWTIPLLGEVARRAGGGKELTVGEAAGVFELADRRLLLRNAAVSSPALGVQGSGAIGPDRQLDLNIVAAPLGDWRDKLKQTNVPIISDVAGEVAGAVQKLVNGATSHLLYEFRVTGTTGHPNVATVPVPALTDSAAVLFSGMLREGTEEGRLLESLGGKREAPGNDPSRAPVRPSSSRKPQARSHAGS